MSDDPSSIDTAMQQPDEQQEQSMLTKDQWEKARLEMAYFKQRIAVLEKLLADDVQPDDPAKPPRTLQ